MSDALLGATIGALVGIVANVLTYRVARMNSLTEEMRRREDRIEAERLARQKEYQQLNWMLARLEKYGDIGNPPHFQDWTDWLDNYAHSSGAVLVVASDEVSVRVDEFTSVLKKWGAELLEGAEDLSWGLVYDAHRDEIQEAHKRIVAVMRRDVRVTAA